MGRKKVLIVVDVQNCFINGGSLGGAQTESLEQIKEILELMKENDHIYLTRDYHPNNHMSLRNTDELRYVNLTNVFPNHCRNRNATCPKRPMEAKAIDDIKKTKDNEETGLWNFIVPALKDNKLWNDDAMVSTKKSTKYEYNNEKKPIIGTDLSYLYFDESVDKKYKEYQNAIDKLIYDPKKQYTIGLKQPSMINKVFNANQYNNNEPSLESINYNINGIPFLTNKKMYELTKGEYCDYESYSAFNYHLKIDYDNSNNVVSSQLPFDKKYSTGLWENIIKNVIDSNTNSELTITVCGLVGNICVMNTIHHGILTWNNLYRDRYPYVKINFVYSFIGTRFLPDVPPFSLSKTNYQNIDEINNNNIADNFIKDFEKLTNKNLVEYLNSDAHKDNIKLYYIMKDVNKLYALENVIEVERNINTGSTFNKIKNTILKELVSKNVTKSQTGGNYYEKYLKYKNKYLSLKNELQ
jgi:nicotinamidase-related amidase